MQGARGVTFAELTSEIHTLKKQFLEKFEIKSSIAGTYTILNMNKEKIYKPTKKVLENYADILVNFALNSGKGIKKGDTVIVSSSDSAKPLYAEVLHAILKSGGNIIEKYYPSNEPYFSFDKTFYECANEDQLTFFPKKYLKGLIDQADHSIFLIAETDKKSLRNISPEKIMKRQKAMKPYVDWMDKKENLKKFTWTLALYGTPQMAKEAKMSQSAYWNQIIKACYLDHKDPISKWKDIHKKMKKYLNRLNKLDIEKMHIEGEDVDLWIKLGEKRKWIGGGGNNIPSFELFTSPDWRGTEGWVRFNQPLYRYGNLIEDIELEFKNGKVVKSKAKKNQKVLRSMIASENADKIGEFSLTDTRFSRITKFMAETLYDENVGGKFGNTHIALGASFHECFNGDPSKVTKAGWKKMGFNDSPIHTDIVSTSDRTVTAYLKNGTKKIIYKLGQFVL